jgi:hypothetical protein
MSIEEKPPAGDAAKGADGSTHNKFTAEGNTKQALGFIFRELANDRIWVTSDQNKAPCNNSGEPFNGYNKPDTILMTYAEAQAVADKFNLPNIGVIFPATGIVRDGYRLLCLDGDEVTGYRKYRPEKPGKPGCSAITFDPATDGAEVLNKVPLVAQLPATVWEASVSNTGFHGFLWVKEEQAAPYWGRNGATLDGCAHVDTFIAGKKPRHLIVTGVLLGNCGRIAKVDDITLLKPLLQLANAAKGAPELLISGEGKPIDLTALEWLDREQRILVTEVGKGGGIDRSKYMHGFAIKLIDHCIPIPDILASLCDNEATADYLLDHRNQDPVAAVEFARYEIARAYEKSKLFLQHTLMKYYPAWGDGELLVDPDKAPAPEALCTSMSDFMKARKPQQVLVDGILYKGDHNAAMGHPNAGKTAGILDMALHVALGLAFGKHAVKQDKVVYIAGEDPDGIRRRIKLWCLKRGIKDDALDGRLLIVQRPVLDNEVDVTRLQAELETILPGLMIVDTFSANYGGESEDKATEVKKWMKMIREEFVTRSKCCVVTLHHPPKGATDVYNWRGSGMAAGDLDNVFCFRNLGDDHICMDQADGRAKHRTALFDPVTWQTEVTTVGDWVNNLGKLETSVFVKLAGDYKIDTYAKICRAIQALNEVGGKYSQNTIAKLAGVPPGSIYKSLEKMKVKNGLPSHPNQTLVTVKVGRWALTKYGKSTADFAVVDVALTKRIEALKKADGDDDDE